MLRFFLCLCLFKLSVTVGDYDVNAIQLQNIQQYMDIAQDPCEDFYNYACGKWHDFHKLGPYTETTGLVDYKLNKLLLSVIGNYTSGQSSLKAKILTYYSSCRGESKHRILQYLKVVTPARDINWPLIDQLENKMYNWESGKFSWLQTLAILRSYGLNNVFIEELVLPSLRNATRYLIDIDKPSMNTGKKLPNLAVQLVFLMEIGLSFPKALKLSKSLQEFELKLEEVVHNSSQYELLTISISEVQSLLRNWHWQEYFKTLLAREISEDFTFQLRNFPYLMGLAELLDKTEPELICNYLMFRFVYFLSLDASSSADKIDCMVDLRSKMDLAMNFIYAEEFYKKEAKVYNEDVRQIIQVIREVFREKLVENKIGLTSEELEFLNEKLDKMGLIMGNLPNRVNADFVERYYESTELERKNYHKNHLSLLKLRFIKEHDPLLKGRPNSDDYFFVTDSDTARSSTPFYLVRQNLIVVPYGFLQTPIYHHNMHDVLKYSLLGFNLAHEIAHGYDASGALYDYQGSISAVGGRIVQNQRFAAGAKCMQHDKTPYANERFADLLGLDLAFKAYFGGNFSSSTEASSANRALEEKSEKQLFFLNFAQFFCGKSEAEADFVDHDSDKVRLHESLMNKAEFVETFHCYAGDKMYRKQKCQVW